jgi:hypothetical protein
MVFIGPQNGRQRNLEIDILPTSLGLFCTQFICNSQLGRVKEFLVKTCEVKIDAKYFMQ